MNFLYNLDLPPIAPGDHNTSPVERYPAGFSNPFGVDSRPRSSGLDDPLLPHDAPQNRLHSPGSSSLVPIARSVVSEEEHESVPPDPSVSKTYSFVSLPGNAVRKRPRRRYDEIERLYHCSWIGCTKSYGTLNHLNAHIVMQRHGNKRTPAGKARQLFDWR
jgi:transcription factor CON7